MGEFLDILKYILPSLIVLAASYLILHTFLKGEHKKALTDLKLARQKTITPIRLQAYERMTLFLERISPQTLVMRVHDPKTSASQLQMTLLKTIRQEYEHNLSQQVYISDELWEEIKTAKEEMIKLVNTAMGKLNDNASSTELSQLIINMSVTGKKEPAKKALSILKKETRQLF